MEQPRGQQPALLPDQLPDGGRRRRRHRGVGARAGTGDRGSGIGDGGSRIGDLGPGSGVAEPRGSPPGLGEAAALIWVCLLARVCDLFFLTLPVAV